MIPYFKAWFGKIKTLSRTAVFFVFFCFMLFFYVAIPLPEAELPMGMDVIKADRDRPFSIHFTQPMNQNSVVANLLMTPPLPFDVTWPDNQTLEIHPQRSLSIDDRFSVTIGGAGKSVYGKSMKRDFALHFLITGPPAVEFVWPFPPDHDLDEISQGITIPEWPVVEPEQAITVLFDRPMDTSVTRANALIHVMPELDGKIEWMSPTAFQFFPKEWGVETLYEVTIPPGIASANGGKTEDVITWRVQAPPFKVVAARSSDRGVMHPASVIYLEFNDIVDLNAIRPGENLLLYPSNDVDSKGNLREDGFFNTDVTYLADVSGQLNKKILKLTPTFPYLADQEYRLVAKAATKDFSVGLPIVNTFEWTFSPAFSDETTGSASRNELTSKIPFLAWNNNSDIAFFGSDHQFFEVNSENVAEIAIEVCPIAPSDFFALKVRSTRLDYPCQKPQHAERSLRGHPENSETTVIDIEKIIAQPLSEGLYVITIDGIPYEDHMPRPDTLIRPFLVSDTVLHFKKSDGGVLVWAVDRLSGDGVARMELTLFDYEGREVARGVTDGQGVYKVRKPLGNNLYVVGKKTVEDDRRWSLVTQHWNGLMAESTIGSMEDLQDFNSMRLLLNTDRLYYRPGDLLYFHGLYRRDQDAQLSIPFTSGTATIRPIPAKIAVYFEDIKLNAIPGSDGSFYGKWQLPADLPAGRYEMKIAIDSAEGTSDFQHSVFIRSATSSSSLIHVHGLDSDYSIDDVIDFDIYSFDSFPGQTGITTTMMMEVYRQPYVFDRYPAHPPYSFGDWHGIACLGMPCAGAWNHVNDFSIEFNAHGATRVNLNKYLAPEGGYRYRLTFYDVAGDGDLLAESSFVIHPGDFYVGFRPHTYYLKPGDALRYDVVAVDWQGRLLSKQKIALDSHAASAPRLPSFEPLLTDVVPVTGIFNPSSSVKGDYILRAETQDEYGHFIRTTVPVAFGMSEAFKSEKNSLAIKLIPDQAEYLVGGKATFMVVSPQSFRKNPQKALLTYERGEVIDYEVISLTGGVQFEEVLIKENMLPNFFVTLSVLNHDSHWLRATTGVSVYERDQMIDIVMSSDWAYEEGQKVANVVLHTADYQQRPLESHLLVMVHKGGSAFINPLNFFYNARTLSVWHALNASMSWLNFDLPLSENPVSAVRPLVSETIYFNPAVRTDVAGKVALTFPVPDDFVTGQMTVIAWTDEDRFGFMQDSFQGNSPLVIEPLLPPFIVAGDQFSLQAKLTNVSDLDHETKIELVIPGVTIAGNTKRSVLLRPGEIKQLEWPITVLPTDQPALSILFRTREVSVAVSLPVLTTDLKRYVVYAGSAPEGWSEKLTLPALPDGTSGVLRTRVSASVRVFFANAFDRLKIEDDHRLEVAVTRLLAGRFLHGVDKMNEDDYLDLFASLHRFERQRGGYSLWSSASTADPLWTACALFALYGFEDDVSALKFTDHSKRSIEYLWSVVRDRKHAFSDRVLSLWVLSELGKYDTAAAIEFFEQRSPENLQVYGWLLMTMQNLIDAGQKSLIPFTIRLQADVVNASIASQDAGVLLMAFNRVDPANIFIDELLHITAKPDEQVAPLMLTRLWRLLGLYEHAQHEASAIPSYDFDVIFDGNSILSGIMDALDGKWLFSEQNPIADLNTKQGIPIRITKSDPGRLYFDIDLQYAYSNNLSQARDHGFMIARHYDIPAKDGVITLRTGDFYRGQLTVITPETMTDVVIEEPIPAGLTLFIFGEMPNDASWNFDHSNVRDDRLVFSAKVLPKGVHKIDFVMRANYSGLFQHLPARVYRSSDPSVFGQTTGEWVEVK
jgi:alpha-2-macroglobulin